MKEKFGIEIETISKETSRSLATMATVIVGRDRIDTSTFSYHQHDINKYGFESDVSICVNNKYPYGVEIVTPPLHIHELGEIKQLLAKYRAYVNTNKTCGLHVHFEIKDIGSVKNVLLIWRRFEKDIFKFFPMSRKDNRYCRPMGSMSISTLLGMGFDRYHMVNVRRWPFNGTVEFRGHNGTVDYHKIKRWVLFLSALVRTSIEYLGKNEELAEKLKKRSLNMFEFLGLHKTKTEKFYNGRARHFEKKAA